MTMGPRYCTHAREFHALEQRALTAEARCQHLHDIISDLRDNEAYLRRRLDVMQERERKLTTCGDAACDAECPCLRTHPE